MAKKSAAKALAKSAIAVPAKVSQITVTPKASAKKFKETSICDYCEKPVYYYSEKIYLLAIRKGVFLHKACRSEHYLDKLIYKNPLID